jgi:hypothetical protein
MLPDSSFRQSVKDFLTTESLKPQRTQPGTLSERLERAEKKLLATKEEKIKTLDSLCERYVAAKMAGEPTENLASHPPRCPVGQKKARVTFQRRRRERTSG